VSNKESRFKRHGTESGMRGRSHKRNIGRVGGKIYGFENEEIFVMV